MLVRSWLVVAVCFVLASAPPAVRGGEQIKPSNLDKLNTDADEDDPFPLPDGITLLYTKKVGGTFRIYLSRRASPTATWPAGTPFMKEKEGDQRTPFFHKPTTMFYFATNEAPAANEEEKNFDIYRKIEQTAPVPVPGISTPQDELGPWITPGGKELYFSRMTKKGWMLYVADGPVPGPIGKARAIGFPPEFHRATLSPTGLVMYLQGPVEGEEGKSALYRSKRAKVGAAWSKPEPVAGLRHPEAPTGDMSPSLSADGTRLYFVSDRPGGKGGTDLWWVPVAQLK